MKKGVDKMDFGDYYEAYWKNRKEKEPEPIEPIRSVIPGLLVKYSSYGAILNQIPENVEVLDIGCGDGNVSSLYLKKACKVTGMDISEKALEYAAKRGIGTLNWDINEAPLPLKNNSFDVIVFSDALEHTIDPVCLLKEVYRVLKQDGKVILSVPNFGRLSNRLRMLIGDPIDLLHFSKYGDEVEHLHWFTKPKIKFLMHQVGFKKIELIPVGLPFGFLFGRLNLHGFGDFLLVRGVK